MANGIERRRKERFGAKLFLEIMDPRTLEKIDRGVVLDASVSGLMIETEADLEHERKVECHIEIPLTVKAKVVRRISEGQVKQYGLRITNQSFMDKLIIKKLLKGKLKTKKV